MIPDQLRIQPGQQALTPAQEAEARRCAEEYIRRQLSTEPVDEQEAEAFLRQAYQVAGLDSPERIQWLGGPLSFVEVLASPSARDRIGDSVWASIGTSLRDRIGDSVGVGIEANVQASLRGRIRVDIRDSVVNSVRFRFRASSSWTRGLWTPMEVARVEASIWAYEHASWLAAASFFDTYLAPNDLVYLARFNQMVSGYWLGSQAAVILRRPIVFSLDTEGRLHNETGKCLEYPDGWGLYAWHGVLVPERIILAPERLSSEDFFNEENVEMRRVIQERMGSRFVPEVGGQVIDRGPRGVLYR